MFELPELKHAFVIFDPNTGLYSKGGYHHNSKYLWRKKPKIWASEGRLKNHFGMWIEYKNGLVSHFPYKGHEEIQDIVNKIVISDVKSYIEMIINDRNKKKIKKDLKMAKYREEEAKRILNEAQVQYDSIKLYNERLKDA